MTKSVTLIVPAKAEPDMIILSEFLKVKNISLITHSVKKPDLESLRAALLSAISTNSNLTISMVPLPIRKGARPGFVFPPLDSSKLTQYERFIENSIPTPKTIKFQFGMSVDGSPLDMIVLKPAVLDTSIPDSMVALRKGLLPRLMKNNFRKDHPIHSNPYVVQEFINTSSHPTSYRVVLFCGMPILSYRIVSKYTRPTLSSNQAYAGRAFISNNNRHDGFEVFLFRNAEMEKMAIEMFRAVGCPPLANCDLLFSEKTGWNALEISGVDFNGWPLARRNLIQSLGRNEIVGQFDMFNVIAERIFRLTNEKYDIN